MAIAPIATSRANKDLDLLMIARLQNRREISNVRFPTACHFVQAEFVGTTICGPAVDDDGLWRECFNPVPKVLGSVAVAEHGIGGEDAEFGGHCYCCWGCMACRAVLLKLEK
jgi:hypothetical protein